mmetsp:Transcript_8146/g.13688  ORF Transcript_8146/g.13688 Transcript_8146/m.13688 type:complete len:241 (-) Transcript_8146:127-849(-)
MGRQLIQPGKGSNCLKCRLLLHELFDGFGHDYKHHDVLHILSGYFNGCNGCDWRNVGIAHVFGQARSGFSDWAANLVIAFPAPHSCSNFNYTGNFILFETVALRDRYKPAAGRPARPGPQPRPVGRRRPPRLPAPAGPAQQPARPPRPRPLRRGQGGPGGAAAAPAAAAAPPRAGAQARLGPAHFLFSRKRLRSLVVSTSSSSSLPGAPPPASAPRKPRRPPAAPPWASRAASSSASKSA